MAKDPICGMDVSENSPLKIIYENVVYYFCCEHCLKKFSKEHRVASQPACCIPKSVWYHNKMIWFAIGLIIIYGLSIFIPLLQPFGMALGMYFQKAWLAVLLGLLIGGVIDHYIPHEYISYVLARRKKRTIFYSVMLGFFMSVCNHGILAISMELYKKGASTSAVVAFLLASPWANLPLTFMLIGFFGLVKAFYIILSAIIIALVTGMVYQFLEERGMVEVNKKTVATNKNFSIIGDLQMRMKGVKFSLSQIKEDAKAIQESIVALSDMILWWLLIGMTLASLAAAYVPAHIFKEYMGRSVVGLLVTLVAATVIEVCSEGMSPLAFEIYRQTGAIGNSLVFLMAGVATDYTEIGLIWQNIGRRAAFWLPVITVPQIILWGVVANIIF